MNQQQAALIAKLGLTDEQIGVMFPDVASRHYGVVREWGAKGGTIECFSMGEWRTHVCDCPFVHGFDYRPVQRTVTITGPGGTFEIPEPVRTPLKKGQAYRVADFGSTCEYAWSDDSFDKVFLAQGRIHLTEEAAQAHADALAKLMQKEGKP